MQTLDGDLLCCHVLPFLGVADIWRLKVTCKSLYLSIKTTITKAKESQMVRECLKKQINAGWQALIDQVLRKIIVELPGTQLIMDGPRVLLALEGNAWPCGEKQNRNEDWDYFCSHVEFKESFRQKISHCLEKDLKDEHLPNAINAMKVTLWPDTVGLTMAQISCSNKKENFTPNTGVDFDFKTKTLRVLNPQKIIDHPPSKFRLQFVDSKKNTIFPNLPPCPLSFEEAEARHLELLGLPHEEIQEHMTLNHAPVDF